MQVLDAQRQRTSTLGTGDGTDTDSHVSLDPEDGTLRRSD